MMTWRQFCYRFYKRVQNRIAPGLVHTQVVYAQALKSFVVSESRWLELGCGHQLLRSWSASSDELRELAGRPALLVGLDLFLESLRQHSQIRNKVLGTATELPFADGAFDLVAANMVVEHLDSVSTVLNEVNRILAPGGRFVFHTTNRSHYMFRLAQWTPQRLRNKIIWILQKRAETDIFPTRYKMNDPKTITALAAETGFAVRELNMMESESMTIALGPLVVVELLLTRLLLFRPFWRFRSNIIAVLEKPEHAVAGTRSRTFSRELSHVACGVSDAEG